MAKYYKNRQNLGDFKSTKFDSSLNASNCVEFSLKLRNDEAIQFGAAYETIKYESKIRYWFPKMPVLSSEELDLWRHSIEAAAQKKQLSNVMEQCGKYDEACNKACETLLSSKYMSPELRSKVTEHPLFIKVLDNTMPSNYELTRYAIGEISFIDINPNGSVKRLESEDPDYFKSTGEITSRETASQSIKSDGDTHKSISDSPVESGIRSKNLVLLLKIIRAVVLRLSPDAQQLQVNELDRCYQLSIPFHSWYEIYQERVRIASAVGHIKNEEASCSHFLQRVNPEFHLQAINTIYAIYPRPDLGRSVQIIKEQKAREENRILEYQSVIGSSKKQVVGLINTTSGPSPTRPCRYCGAMHWHKDCLKKLAVTTPSRPCVHCGGNHFDNKCNNRTALKATNQDSRCQVCGDKHKIITCPAVRLAKESLTGQKAQHVASCVD